MPLFEVCSGPWHVQVRKDAGEDPDLTEEGIYIPSGLGAPLYLPEVAGERVVWSSLLELLSTRLDRRYGEDDGWMEN